MKNLVLVLVLVVFAAPPHLRAGWLGDNGFVGEAGYGFSSYQYKEPGLMRINGLVQTVFAKLGYVGWNYQGFVVNYNTTIAANTTYYGATIGSNIPINDLAQSDSFWSVELLYAQDLSGYLGASHKGIAYVGFGYRSLKNENMDNTFTYNGITIPLSDTVRRQDYFYIPIGVYGKENIISDLWVRYGLEGRWMFYGANKSQVVSNGIVAQEYRFKQKNGFGFKVSLGFDYEIAQAIDIFAQAALDYWQIPESSKVWETAYAYWIEPKNNTLQLGLEVGLRF